MFSATISPGRPEPRATKLGIDVTSNIRTPRMRQKAQ
ncbi:hypothetical protein M7I_3956 [Glarea lozoyensis 74030]|uniref:Uncharacterized protein n=1 Tax=Glarea lozoyensis (strain ATCC 74030 / MF5533) TaxID=1104152 RepID=H0EMV8_GLAL7|nr:hypothetical protein M7I_3956 [Glarea lozoyensis 74030]